MSDATTPAARAYRVNLDDLDALVQGLRLADEGARVPATPDWRVRDVLAHLDGSTNDMLADRMDGAPWPEWTARHVAERTDVPAGDLFSSLRSQSDDILQTFGDADDPAPLWDLAVHVADLREALGLGRAPKEGWEIVRRVAGKRWLEGYPDLMVDDYEIFRALFSRRSRAQIRAWSPGLSDAHVDGLGVFGPRDDDQPVPRASSEPSPPHAPD